VVDCSSVPLGDELLTASARSEATPKDELLTVQLWFLVTRDTDLPSLAFSPILREERLLLLEVNFATPTDSLAPLEESSAASASSADALEDELSIVKLRFLRSEELPITAFSQSLCEAGLFLPEDKLTTLE